MKTSALVGDQEKIVVSDAQKALYDQCTAQAGGTCKIVDGGASGIGGAIKNDRYIICTAAVAGGQQNADNLTGIKDKGACEAAGGTWKDNACAGGAGQAQQDTSCPLPDDADMRWLACAVVAAGQTVTNKLYMIIQDYMYIDTGNIFGDNANSTVVRDAARAFRNLGIAIVLIAGLIMVIAQASGTDIVDAYTIRKTLPRMGIALIGIALSWPLMKLAINLTNDLGMMVGNILNSVVVNGNDANMKSDIGFANAATGTILTAGGILGMVAVIGPWGVLSFVWTIVVALLIGMFVLAIRQIIVITCVMIASLAIASYVLPGTQKLWEFWKKTFVTTLLMFPIVMLFLGAGRTIASIVGANGTAGASLLATIVFFAPYFMLPFAFKMAGGLMSTIFSIANDRNRGLFDRAKKFRQGQVQKNLGEMKMGNRFNNGLLNATTARASTQSFGFGRRGREALAQKMKVATGEFAKSAQAQGVSNNDYALRAMTYRSAGEARQRMGTDWGMSENEIRQAIAGAQAAGGFGTARSEWAAKQLAAVGTGYDDDTQMFATIARVSGGNRERGGDMWGDIRAANDRAGRHDLRGDYKTGTDILKSIYDYGENGHMRSTAQMRTQDPSLQAQLDQFSFEGARSVDAMTFARDKPKAISNMMYRMDRLRAVNEAKVEAARANGARNYEAEQTLGQIAATLENKQEAIAYYAPESGVSSFHTASEVGGANYASDAKQHIKDELGPAKNNRASYVNIQHASDQNVSYNRNTNGSATRPAAHAYVTERRSGGRQMTPQEMQRLQDMSKPLEDDK